MNSKRLFIILLAVICLLGVGIIASAVLGNSMLEKKSADIVSLKTDNQVLNAEELSLNQAKKDIQKYSELEKQARAIVPADKNQAAAVREIVKIAQSNGIKISSITFPASALGGITATGSGGAAKPAASTALTQVQPVKGISGVYSLPITIQNDVKSPISYSDFINFLSQLEQNRRTAQVSSITLQPSTQNPSQLTFNLVLDVYLKP